MRVKSLLEKKKKTTREGGWGGAVVLFSDVSQVLSPTVIPGHLGALIMGSLAFPTPSAPRPQPKPPR